MRAQTDNSRRTRVSRAVSNYKTKHDLFATLDGAERFSVDVGIDTGCGAI